MVPILKKTPVEEVVSHIRLGVMLVEVRRMCCSASRREKDAGLVEVRRKCCSASRRKKDTRRDVSRPSSCTS